MDRLTEFIIPKTFTLLAIIFNLLAAIWLGYVIYYVVMSILLINLIFFFVTLNVKLSFIFNLIVFGLSIFFLIFPYITFIIKTDAFFSKEEYYGLPYPIAFFDHLNFRYRMGWIGYNTLIFVAEFTNVLIYTIYWNPKNNVPMPDRPILGSTEE